MAIAVSVDDVRLIFETPMSDSQLNAFLKQAVSLVEERLVNAGHSEIRLKDISCNLAAHFACAVTPFTSRERVGREYEMERAGKFEEGLKSTAYGQAVLALDTSGVFASALGGRRLRVTKVSPSGDED